MASKLENPRKGIERVSELKKLDREFLTSKLENPRKGIEREFSGFIGLDIIPTSKLENPRKGIESLCPTESPLITFDSKQTRKSQKGN